MLAFRDERGTIESRAFGLADRETGRAHRAEERWPWASVTKQVTAALVMREVDAGRLRLDATLRELLPAFTGATADRITLRHLLQHTSGLPNPESTAAAADGVPEFYRERGAVIGDAARASGYCSGTPAAAPGERFDYNNCDYLVLGAVLERATGRSYTRLVRDAVAKPLRLGSLNLAPDGVPLGGAEIVAYADDGARAPAVNVATYGAGGALVGSARDLLEFDAALISNRLVGPASRAEMWRGDPALGYAALGAWSFPAALRGCDGPVQLVERRGEVGGVRVRNVIAPAIGRAFVAFTNDARADFGEIWQGGGLAWELASELFCTPR